MLYVDYKDMTLSDFKTIGFIPSVNLEVANEFYSGLLGLRRLSNDEYANEYEINQAKLRVAKVNEAVKASHTVFGWEVTDIQSVVEDLKIKGVEFMYYEGIPQDENGIATFPNGGKVAWFKDPDENILSITQP